MANAGCGRYDCLWCRALPVKKRKAKKKMKRSKARFNPLKDGYLVAQVDKTGNFAPLNGDVKSKESAEEDAILYAEANYNDIVLMKVVGKVMKVTQPSHVIKEV